MKKPNNYSEKDAILFNMKIDEIERDLNVCAPAMSELKATYIRGSNKKKVFFQGFRYAKPSLVSEFRCTYKADTDSLKFNFPCENCFGRLVIDDDGVIQPRTIIRHYHDSVMEVSILLK